MSDVISGLAGYNMYVKDPVAGTYTKNNNTPVIDMAHYTFTNLLSNTDYSGLLFWRSVDNAGNEDPTYHAFTVGTVRTRSPLPDEDPMSSTDVANIDAIVASCMAAGDIATSVTIAIDSPKGFLQKTYGDGGTAVNDHYRVASQTKTFTGTAVLMAIDAGRLALDTNLSAHVGGIGYADPTVQQMMQHISGIYDYEQNTQLALTFGFFPNAAYTVDQIIALIEAGSAGNASQFAPGTSWFYTNSNYYMLAKMVEATDPAGRTIDQIIQQDILTPLGMVNTYFQTAIGTPAAPYAGGFYYNLIFSVLGGKVVDDASNQNPAFIWAAGAVISVISDMIIWGKELRDGTLLSSDMQELRRTTFIAEPVSPLWGLNFEGPPTVNWCLALQQWGSWFGHDGSWLGCDSCTAFEPHTGAVISVYENYETGAPHVLAAVSTIWYEIASYMYPGSTNNPGYLTGENTTGTIGTRMQKMATAATGSVYEVGAFQPFNEVNVAKTNASVPDGCTGVWVTLIGAGGPGGTGTISYNCAGGAGGGGGGRVNRIWIPVASLASTYSVSFGVNGTDTVFTSGSLVLTAHGGTAGAPGANYSGSGAPVGVGGGWSSSVTTINSVTITGANGSNGGTSLWTGGSPGNANSSDAGPGGPGGRGSYGGLSGAQQPGAASSTVAAPGAGGAGIAAPVPSSTGTAGPGHAGSSGGEGAPGGAYGAGGGGGYSDGNVYGQPGGAGAIGLALLEWQ